MKLSASVLSEPLNCCSPSPARLACNPVRSEWTTPAAKMMNLTLVFTLLTVTTIFTSRCSAQKSTTSSSSSSLAPTLAPGNSDYKLLGCYTELPANSNARALGVSNKYYAPLFATPDTVDVTSCLEACSTSLAPNGEGTWIFAAVENSR